jgi:hypothetical protein
VTSLTPSARLTPIRRCRDHLDLMGGPVQ